MALVKEIDDTPERPDRSGRKRQRLLQTLVFYLYCRYPGIMAPRSVEELHNKLKNPDDGLAPLLIFDHRVPAQNTLLKWFRSIDEADSNLVKQALLDISDMLPWHPVPKEDPKKKGDKKTKPSSTRTREVNSYIKRREDEALGEREFEALFRQDVELDAFTEESKAEELILEWAHNNDLRCHRCKPEDCAKLHDHGVEERLPTSEQRKRKQRRRWRCRCCRSYLSVTSGTLLHSLKLPLKTVLKCLYYMIRARRGISAMQMAGYFNCDGRNMPAARMLKLMHRIRTTMGEAPPVFQGTTEIDEAVFVLSDRTKAHLIGAYNHETRRVYVEVLEQKATKEMMRDFINRVTAPGSRIYVDGDAAVPRTGCDRDTTREYYAVNHSMFEWSRRVYLGDHDTRGILVTTNRIEGSWGFLKRAIGLRGSVGRYHLPLYLAEVMWRLNYLGNRAEAEAYEGQERRELALIKRVVAGIGGKRVTEQQLRGSKAEPPELETRQLPLTPEGRGSSKAARTDDTDVDMSERSDSASEVPVQRPVQMVFPWGEEEAEKVASPVRAKKRVKKQKPPQGFAAQSTLGLFDEMPAEYTRQRAA